MRANERRDAVRRCWAVRVRCLPWFAASLPRSLTPHTHPHRGGAQGRHLRPFGTSRLLAPRTRLLFPIEIVVRLLRLYISTDFACLISEFRLTLTAPDCVSWRGPPRKPTQSEVSSDDERRRRVTSSDDEKLRDDGAKLRSVREQKCTKLHKNV